MNILRWPEVFDFAAPGTYTAGSELAEKIVDQLAALYPIRDGAFWHFKTDFADIYCAAKGSLEGKTILDLGCGSTDAGHGILGYRAWREPWLCRALLLVDAHPIGIDLDDLRAERFENYRVDLNHPKSLEFLRKKGVGIDLAIANQLFTDPSVAPSNHMNTGFYENIATQLESIVKPDGVFIYHDRD